MKTPVEVGQVRKSKDGEVIRVARRYTDAKVYGIDVKHGTEWMEHPAKWRGAASIQRHWPEVVTEGVDWKARCESAEADNAELLDVLKELADLMEGVRDGSYTPDSFTLQPTERVLSSRHPGAALLEELEGLRKQVAESKVGHLVRAEILKRERDAALEEAARLFAYAMAAHLDSDTVQFRIRALKKTGQGA